MKKIVIVDYGFGNLFSLAKALVHLGANPEIVAEPVGLDGASALILPGVGAFGDGMTELKRRKLDEPILAAVKAGKPLLGICLGMQFLFEKSSEFGNHAGLGIFKGEVKKIEISDEPFCKIPHVGWNALLLPDNQKNWSSKILTDVKPGAEAYFVHSYAPVPAEPADVVSNTCYCGSVIPAVVAKRLTVGVQFHPEKSGEVGVQILKNFLSFA